MPSLYVYDSPKLLSGTRLNLRTLSGEEDHISKKFGITPVKHPLIDLPFSLLADMIVSLGVIPLVTYEWLFEG